MSNVKWEKNPTNIALTKVTKYEYKPIFLNTSVVRMVYPDHC